MSSHVHSFPESHPQMEKQIKALAGRSSVFSDVWLRFGRVWDSLNALEREPVDT